MRDPAYDKVDISVAWVRVSGLRHVEADFTDFLRRGSARVVVGVDGDNTSYEGLTGLVALSTCSLGRLAAFVRHNEGPSIFHPKVYAFRGSAAFRLLIGSSNLTQSGLFQNEEASVVIDAMLDGTLDAQIDAYMRRVTAPVGNLTKPLNMALADDLLASGYVKREADLRTTVRAKQQAGRRGHPLFGRRNIRVPGVVPPAEGTVLENGRIDPPVGPALDPGWRSVYLRLRLSRGTQAQIPARVVRELKRRVGEEIGEGELVRMTSAQTGAERSIRPVGGQDGDTYNTRKFEAREAARFAEPLMRIFLIDREYYFEFVDGGTPGGQAVLAQMRAGFAADPPTTFTTSNDLDRATWFRFD